MKTHPTSNAFFAFLLTADLVLSINLPFMYLMYLFGRLSGRPSTVGWSYIWNVESLTNKMVKILIWGNTVKNEPILMNGQPSAKLKGWFEPSEM